MSAASEETWREYRQRMLDETSRFIEWGLNHPDEVMWIPAKPMGDGGFPRSVADWYWGIALSAGDRLSGWREKLMLVRRFLPGGRAGA